MDDAANDNRPPCGYCGYWPSQCGFDPCHYAEGYMRCVKCYLDPRALNYPCPYANCPYTPRPRPRWRPWLVLVGVALLIAFAVAIYWYLWGA